MFLLDILIDLIINAYVSLGFGTPQRKINIKIEKLSRYHPEVMDLYKTHQSVFEENEELSNLVLKSKIKNKKEKRELATKINLFFKSYKSKCEVIE